MPHYRREPTKRELRERTIVLLKQTRLFGDVSVRLLADLVDRYDLVEVPPAAAPALGPVDPAVLAVPEAPIELFAAGVTTWPPPAFLLPVQSIMLTTGVHLRKLDALSPVADWAHSGVRALGPAPVRIFYLPIGEFMNALPRILVNALDLDVATVVTS